MKNIYERNLNGNEMRLVKYVKENYFKNLEPSEGDTPSVVITTQNVYKNGDFWGKLVNKNYKGNWEATDKPKDTDDYTLTVGDKLKFLNMCCWIMEEYMY